MWHKVEEVRHCGAWERSQERQWSGGSMLVHDEWGGAAAVNLLTDGRDRRRGKTGSAPISSGQRKEMNYGWT